MPQPPVELSNVLLTGLLNPVVVVVAILMGRKADQWQKIPVAGFAAATLGSAVIYVLVRLGLMGLSNTGRAAAGIFIVQMLVGMLWAAAAFIWPRR
jgi:hypothetical protein